MRERRDLQIHFRVSKPEWERIHQKMESCGILSIGSYLRKMAYLLQMCSNNLNQVAKRVNESDQIYTADLEDLRTRLDELISICKQILAKLAEL